MNGFEHLFADVDGVALLGESRGQKAEDRISSRSDTELILRWEADFGLFAVGIHRIRFVREMMGGLLDEIGVKGGEGSALATDCLVAVYAQAQGVAVRRLVDGDRRARSLVLMLEEMECRAQIFDRSRQRDLYSAAPAGMGDEMFDLFAGANAVAVPPERFARLRADLSTDLEEVKRFVDQHVAHADRKQAIAISWHDLDSTIDGLESHLRAIGLVAFGRDLPADAVAQEDWREPFRRGLFLSPEKVDV